MAIDTAVKRGSSINVWLPTGRVLPFPSGTVGVVGRQFTSYAYVGIAAAPPPPFAVWRMNLQQQVGPTPQQPSPK